MILSVYLLSCADDSIDSVEDFQSFLEKNDGSEWLLRNDTLKVFIRINNNETHLIEQWYYLEESNCFDYNPNIFVPGNCTIKENSNECFMVMGDLFLSDYESMTFTNQGALLRVDITLDEWNDETVFFSKSTESVDDLKTCQPIDKVSCLFFKTCW
ncbi:MAG: hypothetical protein WBV45_06835 [Lutimonas sp.]